MKTQKVSLKNKLAFGAGDIFGGGSFNVINFLFTTFLSLVVGLPMIWVSAILLLTKVFDGIIDPFIGAITDGTQPKRFGKRRKYILIFAPIMYVCFVLLFFPWNLVTTSVPLKVALVIFVYVLYATSQSFILIPYYSLASEMTDDFDERNKVSAVRVAFSIISSLVCVAVPGSIANPSQAANDGGLCYIVMSVIFGGIFCLSLIICGLFSKEQIVTPAIKRKITLKEFFKPLKLRTYRNYLGMQLCASMSMAIISSFFFIYCDFYLRRDTYLLTTMHGAGRFPIGTVAAAGMFVAQAIALVFYVWLIKKTNKKTAYVLSATFWSAMLLVLFLLPAETSGTAQLVNGFVTTTSGVPNWLIIILGLVMGIALCGCVYVPHSSVGDVANVGQLYFGERTEGAFSGLTNFLNTTAQAVGLAIPPFIMSFAGYKETTYVSVEEYLAQQSYYDSIYKATVGQNVQLVPLAQGDMAQFAIRLAITLLPIVILLVGVFIATRYRLTKQAQEQIVSLCNDQTQQEFGQQKKALLQYLGEDVSKF